MTVTTTQDEPRRRRARPRGRADRARCPDRVCLEDLRAATLAADEPVLDLGELIVGLGPAGRVVKISPATAQPPHVLAAIPPGAGASTLARLFACVSLHAGAICLILDPLKCSHRWALGLPNVAYPQGIPACHEALTWLSAEISRREQLITTPAGPDSRGRGSVGPRITVLLDGPAHLASHLQQWWHAERAHLADAWPGISPPLEAFVAARFASAAAKVNMLYVGPVAPTSAAAGDGRAQAMAGVRILARPSRQLWDGLAPGHRFPRNASTQPGRVFTITPAAVTETQIAALSGAEARDFALAGTVTRCPAGMPGAGSSPRQGTCP